ncbi:hypothetical protein UFOVP1613_22 [uncultured Caudovirales phage]|uniref:Uncharacterized protein n=1 Tax=uncultured Caudovirales phage TaxID=2100421 RepID=A0A6J5SVC3_9CAUD|nr:hypothetical protein UFOVP1163_24 [uncultured Caudovirales phage]CAB4219275.1 hypothetical protein UFOVP1613_22 [uncultured Caudovirales phage]
MSYFAQVIDGLVTDVIRADQEFIDALPDSERWLQTSYNTHGGVHYGQDGQPDGGIALRANYAGVGMIYDSVNDVFYAQSPYPSWVISAPTWLWQPPVAMPAEGQPYIWDESIINWVKP